MIEKAIFADKKNPLPMYQKANILVSLERFDEALENLEELKEYAPRESSVYALMGRIYKRRNMHDKAMLHFGLALDLKPSAADVATIKVPGFSSSHLFHSYYGFFMMWFIFSITIILDLLHIPLPIFYICAVCLSYSLQ